MSLLGTIIEGKLAKAKCPLTQCGLSVDAHSPVAAWVHATEAVERGLAPKENTALGGPTLAWGGEGDKDGPELKREP